MARVEAGAALMLGLFYGLVMLGGALWLRRNLTPENLAASTACWGARDSIQKSAQSQTRRDLLVLYVLRQSPAAPRSRHPGADLRLVLIDHVYRMWWPAAERNRLFAEIAPRLRRCDAPPMER